MNIRPRSTTLSARAAPLRALGANAFKLTSAMDLAKPSTGHEAVNGSLNCSRKMLCFAQLPAQIAPASSRAASFLAHGFGLPLPLRRKPRRSNVKRSQGINLSFYALLCRIRLLCRLAIFAQKIKGLVRAQMRCAGDHAARTEPTPQFTDFASLPSRALPRPPTRCVAPMQSSGLPSTP